MILIKPFQYAPLEHETEKASNSYLMSLIALMAGMPLPVINMLATLFFFIGNRRGTLFVRWHCTQALFSQLSVVFINGFAVWWTISIIFGSNVLSNIYIAYIITAVMFNITEFIMTIYSAIKVRKGIHVEWWFYGVLTNCIYKLPVDAIPAQPAQPAQPVQPAQSAQSAPLAPVEVKEPESYNTIK